MAAANHFAATLRRRTNKTTAILVHAALEWTLIVLLLVNAALSHLAAKFAAFFGLHPPCILCSRGSAASYRDAVCDAHAGELAGMGFCARHRRLAEAGEMCEDCSASAGDGPLLSWMKRSELGEKDLRCSCCGVALESGFYTPHLHKPLLEVAAEGEEVADGVDRDPEEEMDDWFDDEFAGVIAMYSENLFGVDEGRRVPVELIDSATLADNPVSARGARGNDNLERGPGELISTSVPIVETTERSVTNVLEVFGRVEGQHSAVPVEESSGEWSADHWIHAIAEDGVEAEGVKVEEHPSASPVEESIGDWSVDRWVHAIAEEGVEAEGISAIPSIPEVDEHPSVGEWSVNHWIRAISEDGVEVEGIDAIAALPIVDVVEKSVPCMLETVGQVAEHPFVPPAEEVIGDCSVDYQSHAIPVESVHVEDGAFVAIDGVSVEVHASDKIVDDETNCEISIGSEICDNEQADQSRLQEPVSVGVDIEVEASEDHNGTTRNVFEIEKRDTVVRGVDLTSISPELNDIEEDRAPETPSSVDGIHALHKRFFFERRELGAESLDGSIASEIEGSEPLTTDRLKAALNAERKALSTLYAELEEERSASAVAANQTMAMITRLQGEKAAMQMEALQYQRMMEEQSEYDQEALQLLNELMVKREKEKQELEKELDMYRKKVLLYEAKQRRQITKSMTNGQSATSSASSSGEDSDDISFDCHGSDECFTSLDESNQNTPPDAILRSRELPGAEKHLQTLDESLADFEEERLSILEQLKALEEKLFTMDDESIEHFSAESGHVLNEYYNDSNNDENGVVNGFSDDRNTNGKLQSEGGRSTGFTGRRLLPLFDAISLESGDGVYNKSLETDASTEYVSKSAIDRKKLVIAEEVDHVYERLQALEADREFLKHCVSSLKKGDKGMDLLQEILQHLRDLRNVGLRNSGDAFASL